MSNKIELAQGYAAQREQYGWMLVDTNGAKPARTYHASLAQCCQYVADRKAGECPNSMAVITMWKEFISEIKDITRGVK